MNHSTLTELRRLAYRTVITRDATTGIARDVADDVLELADIVLSRHEGAS